MADFTRFPEAFQKAGIAFTEEPGWRNRGHGDIVQFQFIVVHHTAGGNDAGDIRVVRDGTGSLAGPLSQIVLKRNGQPHIIAAGVCWHAGYGPAMWGAPAGNGNYYSIGIEGVSNGYNDWTPEQRREYPRVVAAILKEAGLPSDRWIFHRDYNKRDGKIDPAGFDAGWFRDEVNRHYHGITQETAIQACYKKYPQLGVPTMKEEEIPTADGEGRFRTYERGAIYWHPKHGAHAIILDFYKKFVDMGYELGRLGYPVGDERKLKDGAYALDFQGDATLYAHPKHGTFEVRGANRGAWAASGYENGPFGFPKTDEIKLPDGEGVMQQFENGTLYHHPKTGSHWVYGRIWDEFSNQKFEQGVGYPTTDELSTANDSGRYNHFQKASIYYKWGTPHAWTVKGDILKLWAELGYERGRLGFPLGNEYSDGDRVRQDFEGGSISDSENDSAILINDGYTPITKKEDVKYEPVTKPLDVAKPSNKYVPTPEEIELLPEVEKRGGISWFAGKKDASTRGRNMGITGEPADNPIDPWFCAMRFGYVGTQPNPSNPQWVKPRDRTDIPESEKFRLKKYLVGRKLLVTNPKNGKQIVVRPADWGPGIPTRMIDVSETAIKALGASTDDQVTIEWTDPNTPVGPVA